MKINLLRTMILSGSFSLMISSFGYASMNNREEGDTWFKPGFLNRQGGLTETKKREDPSKELFNDIRQFNSTHHREIPDIRLYDSFYESLAQRVLKADLSELNVDAKALYDNYSPTALCHKILVFLHDKVGPFPTHIAVVEVTSDGGHRVAAERPMTTSDLLIFHSKLVKPFLQEEQERLRNVLLSFDSHDSGAQLIRKFFIGSLLTMIESSLSA